MTTTTFTHLCDASVERETEKAVLLAIGYSHACGHREIKVWFPKSQVRIDGNMILAAEWLASKKEREIADEYPGFYGFHRQSPEFLAT